MRSFYRPEWSMLLSLSIIVAFFFLVRLLMYTGRTSWSCLDSLSFHFLSASAPPLLFLFRDFLHFYFYWLQVLHLFTSLMGDPSEFLTGPFFLVALALKASMWPRISGRNNSRTQQPHERGRWGTAAAPQPVQLVSLY
ncbi:hypothetical protein F4776DRAFT_201007 [Hypoxylon sp. NC0597]|nr:hypothetical protein F4776DRAFT_201007 [Hypoxylon sp. NC0597]